MIPDEHLLVKPIALRHPFLFYFGHIPTFLDLKLSLWDNQKTEPVYFGEIFERGIDPDVDDPSQCHWHSKGISLEILAKYLFYEFQIRGPN